MKTIAPQFDDDDDDDDGESTIFEIRGRERSATEFEWAGNLEYRKWDFSL